MNIVRPCSKIVLTFKVQCPTLFFFLMEDEAGLFLFFFFL